MIAYGTYITRFRLQAVKIRCQHPASLRWVFVPLLFLLLATDLHAQLISDTLNIRFRRDSVIIDMDFDGNRQRWEAFEREYRERYSDLPPGSLRLDIYAGASPEGPASRNSWLGRHRGNAVRNLVRKHLGSSLGDIVVHNEGARWAAFRQSVAACNEPWRDQVLRIIDMKTNDDPNSRDTREKLLRKLQDGKIWPILLTDHLAPLRSGASAILSWKDPEKHPEPIVVPPKRDTVVVKEPVKPDTVVVRDTVVVKQTVIAPAPIVAPVVPLPVAPSRRDTIVVMMKPEPPKRDTLIIRDTVVVMMMMQGSGSYHYMSHRDSLRAERKARRDSLLRERLPYPAWNVKTNFLLWGVVAPNIQVEIPLWRRNQWSLEVEYFIPWFIWAHNAQASQFNNLGIELRRYLGNRKHHRWLQGWHVGLAVAAGYYDWEWKKHEGYQGEYINTYINIGYQHRWGRHWALDCGLGLGAMITKYRHYYGGSIYPDNHLEPWDPHLIWHDSGRYLWPGPCHANVSLAYMFNAWPFHVKSKKIKNEKK